MADWHYIGHYGQLGPLSEDQMRELIESGVVERQTFVWCNPMADWCAACEVELLKPLFTQAPPNDPPPLPIAPPPFVPRSPDLPPGPFEPFRDIARGVGMSPTTFNLVIEPPMSDKSRFLGGLLNLIPGFGRMYLGYYAIGALQLISAMCGIGFVWSWIDGLMISLGSCKFDGYGRRLLS